MERSPDLCQKCGKPLPGGAMICPSCGTPKPGAYLFTPENEDKSAKGGRGLRFWFGLALLIGGSLVSCISLSSMAVYLLGSWSSESNTTTLIEPTAVPPSPSVTVIQPTSPPASPTATLPALTEAPVPTQTAQPTLTLTATAPANLLPASYSDDFENVESGWERNYGEDSNLDYAPDGNYRIELTIPDKMAFTVPPYPFERPMYNMIISVRAKGEVGNGFVGLLCHLQDDKNYYRAGIANGFYTIHKVINNQFTQLTEPSWKPIIEYEPDADGYVNVTLACEDGRIQLLIDDIGQEIITDTDLNEGDGAIFVWAGNQPDSEGVFMRGYFDDFSAELP